MKRAVFGLIALLAFAASARAQLTSDALASPYRAIDFGSGTTTAPSSGAHGFTGFVNLGVGFQHDFFFGGGAGLAGLNFGIGGFVTHKVAILGRFSGTVVDFSDAGVTQSSGVLGATMQYWASSRYAIEAGGGFGSWSDDNGDGSDASFGLILGVSFIVFEHGSHHLVAGGEYAPVFTADGTVHNLGLTFGYQFFRR